MIDLFMIKEVGQHQFILHTSLHHDNRYIQNKMKKVIYMEFFLPIKFKYISCDSVFYVDDLGTDGKHGASGH